MSSNNTKYQRDYMQRYREKHRRRIVQSLGGKCATCFTTKNLEVHHVIDAHRGIDKNGYDNFSYLMKTIKAGEKHIILCTSCHHRKEVKKLTMFTAERTEALKDIKMFKKSCYKCEENTTMCICLKHDGKKL